MKILIIGTADNEGGAARVGWDIGHELMHRGYDVKYLVGYKKSGEEYVAELPKLRLLKWLDEHTKYNITSLFRHLRAYLFANQIDFGASNEIINHPWFKAADLIHCHNLHGNFMKLSTLIEISKLKPTLWTLHDMWPVTGKCAYTNNPQEWKDGYHRCQNLASYPPTLWDNSSYMWHRKANIYRQLKNLILVSPSQWLENIVKHSILGHLPIRTIYNGVETTIYKPGNKQALRTKLNLPHDKKIVAFVAQGGLSDPRKGWQYVNKIIQYYQNNPNIHFLAIGDGKVISHSNNVTHVPFLKDKQDLANYYSASDCLLFTSLAENCPLVVLEAMSVGLPIVSFKVGGVPELVEDKINGRIARYKNFEDLLHCLKSVLSLSPSKLNAIATINRKKVISHYSIKKMTNQYESLIEQALSKFPNTNPIH